MKLFVEEGAEYREIEVIIRCQKTDSQVMKLISALRAVSYTHLDVYKRQGL